MIKLAPYFLSILVVFSSCNRSKTESKFEKSNELILAKHSSEVTTSFKKLKLILSKNENIELKKCFSTPFDFSLNETPKIPHLVYFLYNIVDEEYIAGFYVDSVSCVSIGYNISNQNTNFEFLKKILIKNLKIEEKKKFIRPHLYPNGYKDIEKSFLNWANKMPGYYCKDTLDSRCSKLTTKYNDFFLPKGHEIIGRNMILEEKDKNKYLFFIVFKINDQFVLSLYNNLGKLKFQRKIFDYEFLASNPNGFCRFYEFKSHFYFENCINKHNNVELVKKDSLFTLDLYERCFPSISRYIKTSKPTH